MGTPAQYKKYHEWIHLVDIEFFNNLITVEELARKYILPADLVREYIRSNIGRIPQQHYFEVVEHFRKTGDDAKTISKIYNIDIFWVRKSLDVYNFKSRFGIVVDFELS